MTKFERWTRFRRYAILGLVTNGLCYLLFLILIRLGVSTVAANGLGYLAGVAMGYIGNRRWTFRSSNRHGHDMSRFVAAHMLGFSASITSIALLVMIIPAEFAQIGAIAIAAVTIYVALEVLGFARQPSPADAVNAIPETLHGD